MDTPFFAAAEAIARRGPRFFVPGHKGNPAAIPAFAGQLFYDITEVDGADTPQNPTGPLLQSQQNMASIYGSGTTLYSAFGTSSCIGAMLALFCGAGGRVLCARGAHLSAVRAMALLDITPHWMPLRGGVLPPQDVADHLARHPHSVVYITSPNYYGNIADVAAIADICHSAGAVLLVDNAHGAHLRFLAENRHPLSLGADACADSAHKTLPCLTPAAMLHLRDAALAPAAQHALNLFCGTSPSHPVLQSLDLAAGLLGTSPPDFEAAAVRLTGAAMAFPQVAQLCDDPLKLCLAPARAGYAPAAFHAALLAQGIAPEYFDGEVLVLMASPYNTAADFAQLEKALVHLSQTLVPQSPDCGNCQIDSVPNPPHASPLPEVVLPLRDALFAPQETVAAAHAAGRVCAGLHTPCPPGVPGVLPGERITTAAAAQLGAGGILEVSVVK